MAPQARTLVIRHEHVHRHVFGPNKENEDPLAKKTPRKGIARKPLSRTVVVNQDRTPLSRRADLVKISHILLLRRLRTLKLLRCLR